VKVHHDHCTAITNSTSLLSAIDRAGIKLKVKRKKRGSTKVIKYVDPIARDIDWVLLDIIVKCMTTSTSTPSKKSPASSPIVVSKLYVKLGHIVVESGGKLSLTNAGDEVIPFTLALDENGSYDIDLFRFFCLQHYFDKAPAMLSQISERSKMYSRTKARLEIKAGDALYSSEDLNKYIASLKILKSPNVSSSSSSSSSFT